MAILKLIDNVVSKVVGGELKDLKAINKKYKLTEKVKNVVKNVKKLADDVEPSEKDAN